MVSRLLEDQALNGITLDGARHAVPSTTTLPELETGDLDDLDPRFAHFGDGERVALIAHDDARLQCNGVVGIVPLLAAAW